MGKKLAKEMFIVSLNGDNLVLLQINGNLNKLLQKAIRANGLKEINRVKS